MGARKLQRKPIYAREVETVKGLKEVVAMLDAWETRAPPAPSLETGGIMADARSTGFASQVKILLRRAAVLTARDPMLYTGRMINGLVAMIFFALVYIKVRERIQTQALQRFFLCSFLIGIPSNFALGAVLAGNLEFAAIKREVRDGQYSPLAAFVATQLLQVPMLYLIGVFSMLPVWTITDWPWEAFGVCSIIQLANLWHFEGIALLLSLVPNPLVGMMTFTNVHRVKFEKHGIEK